MNSNSDKLFFFDHSITGQTARSTDWSRSSLGPVENWPHELKIILGMLFKNKQPVCLFWGKDNIFFYNDGYIPIVGKSKHPQAMGMNGEAVWAEIWEYLTPQINQVMLEGISTWNEDQYLPILGDDGTPRVAYFTYSYSPVYLANGQIGGTLVTCTETTEKVLSMKELAQSEGRFRSIAEALPQLVWTCHPDGQCDYLSKQWIDYTGIPEEDQLGMNWLDKVLHPEDKERTYAHWMGAVNGHHPYDIEYRLRRSDGIYRWFKTRGTQFKNDKGEVIKWFGTCTDIDDSKSAQISFERDVDTSPAMLWITEPDGYCTYLSKQWFENTGQTPETGLGFGWLSATHPDDKELAGNAFIEANRNKKPFRCRYRLRNKNGNFRWAIDAGNPRFDKNGKYLGMAGTVFDIDDVKRAEDKAMELAEELKEAVRIRDEFLSIASHELKTPITSLKMQLQMSRRTVKPEENILPKADKLAKTLDLSIRQVERLVVLIEDLLDVTRLESGKMSYSFEQIDLKLLVEEVLERFSEQIKNSLSLFDLQLKECVITCDRFRIEQVVTNLISNALKYGSGSSITILVRPTDFGACFLISDKGLGIAKENQEKIFQRFERAVSSSNISGLGLGLYISKQIIDSHHGKISIQSELGKGSTFKVELPVNPLKAT